MTDRVEALIAEAQRLSEAERLAVAQGILEALHPMSPENEQEWASELAARDAAYEAGRMPVDDYEEVRKRLGLR